MNRLRRRLFLLFLLVMLLALALPVLYGRQRMHVDILEDMRAATLRQAEVTAALLDARPDLDTAALPAFLDDLARRTGTRLTFVSDSGRVLADTDIAADQVDELPVHADRPEISGALHNGRGSSIRRSATLHLDLIYAAAKVEATPGRPAGIIRVAVPFAGIAGRVDALALRLGMGALLAAVVAWLLSRAVLGRLDQAIRDMTRVVEDTAPDLRGGGPLPRPALPPRREFHTLSVAVSDMADRVENHIRTIEAQKTELASILDHMEEGVLVLDQRGRIRRVNPALVRLFPELGDAVGRLPVEVVPLAELQQAIDALMADARPHSASLTLDCGRDCYLAAQLIRLGARPAAGPAPHGGEVGAVIVLHDVSDMTRLVRVKRDLVANVSHELRTPLTAIQGYADTLLDVDDAPETRRKFINIIRKHASRMVRLVEDLLTLSRLENGEGMSEGEECAPDDALEDALEECRGLADARNTRVIAVLPAGLRVRGDRERLSQVFRNLLENACRYAEPGTPILIGGKVEEGMVRVTVQDFGPGIPESDLSRVFERFHQVEKHRGGGGTGLGLAICKHIVERLGGHIEAEYDAPPLLPGQAPTGRPAGATIHFTLPLVPVASRAATEHNTPGTAGQGDIL